MSLVKSPLKKYLRVDALSVPLSLCSKLGGEGTIPARCSWKISKGEFSSSHYLRPCLDFGLRLLSHTTIKVSRGSCVVECVLVQTVIWVSLVESRLDSSNRGAKRLPCVIRVIALVNKIGCLQPKGVSHTILFKQLF